MRKIRVSLQKLLLIVIILSCTPMFYFLSNVNITEQNLAEVQNLVALLKTISKQNIGSTTRRMVTNSTRAVRSKISTSVRNNGTKPPNSVFGNMTETWQPVDATSNSHYVYSAYLHNIDSKPIIRIIGAICHATLNSPIYCQLRYRNSSMVAVKGSSKPLPEGQGFKYKVGLFHCRLPDNRVPDTVSVTPSPNMTSLNLLRVKSHVISERDRKSFAVCASPLFGEYNNTFELIQWIELNRILGAELILFYPYSTTKSVDRVLKFYADKGIAAVVPWDVSKFRPPGQKQELFYVGQHAALNDCLMKVKHVAEFVVNSDLDEIIVPHSNLKTWHDIVKTHPSLAIYTFRSSFFRLNWKDTDKEFPRKHVAEKLKMSFLLKLHRETKIFSPSERTKYFAKTDVAEVLGIHSIFEKRPGHKSECLPADTALIHHYRVIYTKIKGVSVPDNASNVPKVLDENILDKHGKILIDNVQNIYEEMGI